MWWRCYCIVNNGGLEVGKSEERETEGMEKIKVGMEWFSGVGWDYGR